MKKIVSIISLSFLLSIHAQESMGAAQESMGAVSVGSEFGGDGLRNRAGKPVSDAQVWAEAEASTRREKTDGLGNPGGLDADGDDKKDGVLGVASPAVEQPALEQPATSLFTWIPLGWLFGGSAAPAPAPAAAPEAPSVFSWEYWLGAGSTTPAEPAVSVRTARRSRVESDAHAHAQLSRGDSVRSMPKSRFKDAQVQQGSSWAPWGLAWLLDSEVSEEEAAPAVLEAQAGRENVADGQGSTDVSEQPADGPVPGTQASENPTTGVSVLDLVGLGWMWDSAAPTQAAASAGSGEVIPPAGSDAGEPVVL